MSGQISGYNHKHVVAWRIENGKLAVFDANGFRSCIAIPTSNADGTLSLIGYFLLGSGMVVHRFDENPSVERLPKFETATELPEVNSFDLFDTVVARRCYDPIAIFRNVEAKVRVPDFARLRQTVESGLWRKGDYTFDHIYTALGAGTGWSGQRLKTLRMMELAEEWDNLFPIREMVARVGPADIVVSDMYLPLSFLRRVVDEKCGLEGRNIYLSSHGKHHGTAWTKILSTHRIKSHYGDNYRSDVEGAKRAGIDAKHVTAAAWTRGEQILVEAGLDAFAKAVREARLRSFNSNPLLRRAQLVQFEVNLPLLILASVDVLRIARERGVDTLLMCSRDCNLWMPLMRWMVADSLQTPAVRYLRSSRELFVSGSPEYAAYFQRMSGLRNIVVDVSGTGRTPAHFIASVGGQAQTSVYLTVYSQHVAEFMERLAPARSDVDIAFLSEQSSWGKRSAIEKINMSLEGRASGITFTGEYLEVQQAPNEFGPLERKVIDTMRSAFVGAITILRRSDIRQVPEGISQETLRNAATAVIGGVSAYEDIAALIRL